MGESKEKLKSLLMKVKEETENADLKLNIQKTKIIASCPITSRQIEEGKGGNNDRFILGGSKITADSDCSHEIKRTIALTRWMFVSKVMSLFVNMLSSLVIAFLSKEQASFNFKAAVTICSDFGAPQNKSVTISIVSPYICHEVVGPHAVILVF